MSTRPGPRRASRPRRGAALLRALRAERGSAVAEFPMVAVLIVLIALTIVQAALILHTRNVLTDAAVQGARYASLVGASPAEGEARTEELIARSLGGRFDAQAVASEDADGLVTVHVEATLPLVGLLGPQAALEVQGRAVAEESW